MLKLINNLFQVVLLTLITQFAFADAPDWQDNPGAYEFTASMVAVVHDNGDQLQDSADILAAFDAISLMLIASQIAILHNAPLASVAILIPAP